MLSSIETKNFKLREGDAEKSIESINQQLEQFPPETKAKVVVVDQGNFFFVSAVAVWKSKFFNSEMSYFKKDTLGLPRNWLVSGITKTFNYLTQNAHRYCQLDFTEESPKDENLKK